MVEEPPRRRQSVQFEFRSPPRSGEDVASFRNVHKGYGGQPVYAGLDFRMRRKERWCVLGANGAGKSTLLKLVAGATEPDEGTVTLGASVRMGYFAQHSMDLLDGAETVFESLDGSFPQAGQGAQERRAGVARAFRVERDLAGWRVAIVDDVVTTGATVNALAAELRAAGAASCVVLAIARTGEPAQGRNV